MRRPPGVVPAVDPRTWEPERIIAALRDWATGAGRAPRAYEWSSTGPRAAAARWVAEHPRWPSAGTVIHHFGGWSAGLRAAGLPGLEIEHELPRDARVLTAQALRASGETVRSIAAQLGVHERTVHRYLRAAVCRECGGPALYGERCLHCAPRRGPAADRDEIIAALRAWEARFGAPPRRSDWSLRSTEWREEWPRWPGAATVDRVFGLWSRALTAAGLPVHRYAWNADEALDALRAWSLEHGRAPSLRDARGDARLPGGPSCQLLFGSWNAALERAGLQPVQQAEWSPEAIVRALEEWARWHRARGRGEPSAASYRRWAARQRRPRPSATTIKRHFGGSWNRARAAAGLPRSRGGRPPASATRTE
jgi:hypothetical protein